MSHNSASVVLHLDEAKFFTTHTTASTVEHPGGIAYIDVGGGSSLYISDPAVALALADVLQDTARNLRRNQLRRLVTS